MTVKIGAITIGQSPRDDVVPEIKEIRVVKCEEVGKYWRPVKKRVIEEVIKRQSAEGIDTVTGATESSQGLIEAIKDAQEKAIRRY